MENSVGRWQVPQKKMRIELLCESHWSVCYARKHQNLPAELRVLFKPFQCNLCQCILGSSVTAKDHYGGKKHIGNIKKWLLEHPELERFSFKKTQPNIMHLHNECCKYCNVFMSSEQVQTQFMEKKHQLTVNNGVIYDIHNNNNNSNQYKKCRDLEDAVSQRVENSQYPESFTSVQQTDGSPHLKVAHSINEHLCLNSSLFYQTERVIEDNILDEVLKNDKMIAPGDLSIYRTPSGKYYCHFCNVTVNSSVQFVQHAESRKHKRKCSVSLTIKSNA